MIYIQEEDLQIINKLLEKYPYSFYVYGSRAKGVQQKFSDLDLCIIDETITVSEIAELKGELEESNLPFSVDITPWFDFQEKFQQLINKDLTILRANPNFIKLTKNLFAKFIYLPKALKYSVKESNLACTINCNLNSSMFNIACGAKFGDHDIENKIQEIINQYGKNPFAWWVGPTDTPSDLGQRLANIGLKKEANDYAMVCSLRNFKVFELDRNIVIKQVKTHEQLSDYIATISTYDEYVHEFLNNDKIISTEIMDKNPLFVSYVDGKPLGNGALHFTNDIAGIYDIITLEVARGKGIGTNMMKYLMNFAHQKGYKEVFLDTSSDSGFRIYSKLGFKVVGMYGCYEWCGN